MQCILGTEEYKGGERSGVERGKYQGGPQGGYGLVMTEDMVEG
jgi:hypothetical protein